jgi:hypothetical protein
MLNVFILVYFIFFIFLKILDLYIDVDYKIVFLFKEENLKGGRPQEQILMTINTFLYFFIFCIGLKTI